MFYQQELLAEEGIPRRGGNQEVIQSVYKNNNKKKKCNSMALRLRLRQGILPACARRRRCKKLVANLSPFFYVTLEIYGNNAASCFFFAWLLIVRC